MRKYTKKFNAQVFFLKFNSIKIKKLSNNNHYLNFYEQKERKMRAYLKKKEKGSGLQSIFFNLKKEILLSDEPDTEEPNSEKAF